MPEIEDQGPFWYAYDVVVASFHCQQCVGLATFPEALDSLDVLFGRRSVHAETG